MAPLYRRRPSLSTVSGSEAEVLALSMGPGGGRSRSLTLTRPSLNRMIPLGMITNNVEMQTVRKNVLKQIDAIPTLIPVVHIQENGVIPTAPPEVLKSNTRRKRLTLPDIRAVQIETNEEKERSLLEDNEVNQQNEILLNMQECIIKLSVNQQQWNALHIEEELSRDEIEIQEIGSRPQLRMPKTSKQQSLKKSIKDDQIATSPRNADIITLVSEAAPTTRWNPTSCSRVVSKLSSVGIYNANDVVENYDSINDLLQRAGHKAMHPRTISLLYSLSTYNRSESIESSSMSDFTQLYNVNHHIDS